jgi:hypothetical protein
MEVEEEEKRVGTGITTTALTKDSIHTTWGDTIRCILLTTRSMGLSLMATS